MRKVQWCPNGRALEGVPGEVVLLLARADGRTVGFGHGVGWSMMFGHGDDKMIQLQPGQWIVHHDDCSVTVHDGEPADIPVLETNHYGFDGKPISAATYVRDPNDTLVKRDQRAREAAAAAAELSKD